MQFAKWFYEVAVNVMTPPQERPDVLAKKDAEDGVGAMPRVSVNKKLLKRRSQSGLTDGEKEREDSIPNAS